MTSMALVTSGDFQNNFSNLIARFNITEKRAMMAGRRAIDKTSTWLKRQVSKDIKNELNIPANVIRARLLSYRSKPQQLRSKVWLGLRLIEAEDLGRVARQTKKGVRVGRHFFPGAFRASIYSPGEKIWIRKDSKWFDPDIYPHRKGRGSVPDELKGRFPVVKVRFDPSEAEDILVEWQVKAESYLVGLLYDELYIEIKRAGYV